MRKLTYRITQGTLGLLLAADIIADWYLDHILTRDRPLKPNGAFSIEYASHGTSTFITKGDHLLSISLWIGLFVLFGIGALVYEFNRPDWRQIAEQKTPL